MPITEDMWRDDHPFSSLHKVERRIRDFLEESPNKGYTVAEIADAVMPFGEKISRQDGVKPVEYILVAMYCNEQVNTIRLDAGIVSKVNIRYFKHRPGTKQVFTESTPNDEYFPDSEVETERKPNHDTS